MKAAGYIRVSSRDQVDGTSLDHQRSAILAYATMRGIELVTIYQDNGVSGGMPISERPEGGELVGTIRANEIQAVIVLKLDRGFRNVVDCLSSVDEWEKHGTSLHIVDLGGSSIDTSTASGRFMLTILSAVAEMERTTIKERCNAGRKIRKAGGYLVGETPFGFDVEPTTKKLVTNYREQETISLTCKLKSEGKSYRAIARTLNENGLVTKKGNLWHPQTVKNILSA